jgi:RNA polymerase sigma factor (sigma-70 family)
MRLVVTNNDLGNSINIRKTINMNTKHGEVEYPDAHVTLALIERTDFGDIYEVSVAEGSDPITDRTITGIAADLGVKDEDVYLMPITEYFTTFDRRRQIDEILRAKRSFPNAKDYVALLFDAACGRMQGVSQEIMGKAYEVIIESVQKYIAAEVRRRYNTYPREWEDLIQCSILAVCNDMHKYDPKKGQPTTFIAPIIKHACFEYLADLKGTTPHYLQIENDISRLKRRIAAFEGEGAVTAERVYEMCEGKYSAEQIIANWDLVDRAADISIDNDESGISEIPDQTPNPEEVFLKKERREVLAQLFREALTPKELQILRYNEDEDHKAKQTSEKYAVSANTIKSMKTKAMKRLRAEASTGKYGDDIRNLVEHLWRRHRRQIGWSEAKLANDSELIIAQAEESRKYFEDICSDLSDENDSTDYSFANPEDLGYEIPNFSDEDDKNEDDGT